MNTLLFAAVLFCANPDASNATYRVRANYPANARYLDGRGTLVNVAAAPKEKREACGWFALTDEKPECPEGYYLAFLRYERTADGFKRVYELKKVEVENEGEETSNSEPQTSN